MLTRNIKYTCLFMVLLTVSLCQICTAITVKFEAEDAYDAGDVHIFGTNIYGYSGTGHMLMQGTASDGLDFTVSAREAGNYPLTLRYHDPWGDKQTEVWVNGVHVGTPSVPGGTAGWTDLVFGNISLNEGDNIIRLENGWTWIYFDYISLDGFPVTATDPVPGNHDTASANLAQLCWTNPNPNNPEDVITCDVYLGTTEPNKMLPDYGLPQIADGIEGTCVDVPSTLDTFTTYYWVVDCWDPNDGNPFVMRGYIWDFNTNNSAPDADAGSDQNVNFGNDGDPGSATVTLDGSATTDDGLPSGTLNYVWQQLSGPAGVVIYPYDAATTEVNLSAAGTYEFSLTVDDTDLEDTDTVLVHVYESQCEVYKAQGGTLDLGDITENCVVDLEDLFALTWYWLDCNSAGPCVE